jgi:hypothetical protein
VETSVNPLITSAPRSGGGVLNTPDPRRWWALALLCGAFFMVVLDATIVLVALPSIQVDLGFSEQGLQWVLSAYALTFGGLLLLGGRAADLLGRRRLFMSAATTADPTGANRRPRTELPRIHRADISGTHVCHERREELMM